MHSSSVIIRRGAAAGAESSSRSHSGQQLHESDLLLLFRISLPSCFGKAQVADAAHLLAVTTTGAAQEIEEGNLQAGAGKRHTAHTVAHLAEYNTNSQRKDRTLFKIQRVSHNIYVLFTWRVRRSSRAQLRSYRTRRIATCPDRGACDPWQHPDYCCLCCQLDAAPRLSQSQPLTTKCLLHR